MVKACNKFQLTIVTLGEKNKGSEGAWISQKLLNNKRFDANSNAFDPIIPRLYEIWSNNATFDKKYFDQFKLDKLPGRNKLLKPSLSKLVVKDFPS